jgi:hypothetical protein
MAQRSREDDPAIHGAPPFLRFGGAISWTGAINEKTTFAANDFRNTVPRFDRESRKANQKIVDVLGELADRKKATRAQLALAWVLAQKPWMVPIPGTTKLHRLEENNGAAPLELTKNDLNEIEQAFADLKPQGARYPEAMLKLVGR